VKILLLHPADSPRRGPWNQQHWDLVVDLGHSSEATAAEWGQLCGCPVLRLHAFRRPVADPREAGSLLRTGCGQLVDSFGLDWWELTSLFVHAELETALALRRLAGADFQGDLHATRLDWPVSGFAALRRAHVHSLSGWSQGSLAGRVRRYARAFSRLTGSQALDVAWDKYDADYRWRSRLRSRPQKSTGAVVLVPSAYTNVSRGAAAYAELLPEMNFLLVATRRSGLVFERGPNVGVSELAAYAAPSQPAKEAVDLLERWSALQRRLASIPELELLSRMGILDPLPGWIRAGLSVRNAWSTVLEREPVTAVLCGDDSNWYTRLPVLLARKKNLPTVDFHHGAMDGRFLLKNLPSDVYLAKTEMEKDYLVRTCDLPADRIVLGVTEANHQAPTSRADGPRANIVYFSEPYESVGGRPDEIYRELLPELARLARENGRTVVLKLHPFENVQERSSFVDAALGRKNGRKVEIVSGPLSAELLASAWFGITVESSTVLDCAKLGVPCFHCQWLVGTPWGYGEQYARFGVGRELRSPADIAQIPRMLMQETRIGFQASTGGSRTAAAVLREIFLGRTAPATR